MHMISLDENISAEEVRKCKNNNYETIRKELRIANSTRSTSILCEGEKQIKS